MKPPRAAVIDTNVLVAGLLTSDTSSPTAAALDGMLAAEFVFLLSDALVAEYRAVLLRPAITAAHGLSAREVDELLAQIIHNGVFREPAASAESAPDSKDQLLWDLASSESDTWVVTGDRRLLEARPSGFAVATAREFAEMR